MLVSGVFPPPPRKLICSFTFWKFCGFSTALFLTFRSHNLALEAVKVESTPRALSETLGVRVCVCGGVCWLFIPHFLSCSVFSFSSIHRQSKFHSNPAASLGFCLASCVDYFPGERGSPVRLLVKRHTMRCNPEKRRENKVKAKLWSAKATGNQRHLAALRRTSVNLSANENPILGIWDESMSLGDLASLS